MTGKSRRTPSIGAVTRYWCAIGTTGMPSPTMRPTSAAQMPAAFTTTSHAIGPPSATTPATRPPLTVIATTRVPVAREPERALERRVGHERKPLSRLAGADELQMEPEAACPTLAVRHLGEPRGRGRHAQAAD